MSEELETRDLGQLSRPPAIDLINERQLALLQARAAKGCSYEEVAQFLELCVAYGLDPYAQEAWCSKSRGRDGGEGKLLIMVGRDGLRKIGQRNGIEMDGDVVRVNDRFVVTRQPDRTRVITHEYEGSAEARGEIVGAWAEAYDQRGKQKGYFFAPVEEYRPTSEKKLEFSPWGAQESVMILAAAERQAMRQATPLGGLLAEGEDARIGELSGPPVESTADLIAEWAPNEELAGAILEVLGRAAQVGHAGLRDYATAELALKGRPVEAVELWVAEAHAELTSFEQRQQDAEVEEVQDAEVVPEPDLGPAERAADLEKRSLALMDEADKQEAGDNAEVAEQLRDEAKALHDEAEAIAAGDQTNLDV